MFPRDRAAAPRTRGVRLAGRVLGAVVLLPALWASVYFGAGSLLAGSAPPAPEAAPECGRLLVQPAGGVAFHAASTKVALVLDEEWQAHFGDDSAEVARSLLADAGALFRGVNIHLLPVRVGVWQSPDGQTTAAELLRTVKDSTDRGDADIVIALTGQELNGGDGRADVGGRYALIEYHEGRPERDAFVLVHEIAHLFGATHGCDLPGHDGVMAVRGFDEPGLICSCTRGVLEANAARFHEQAALTEDAAP